MQRIVIDTCVFMRALFGRDPYARQVLDLVEQGRVQLLISGPIRSEITSTVKLAAMCSRFPATPTSPPFVKLDRLLDKALCVRAPKMFFDCVDKPDNKFFDCAIAGQADCIKEPANPPVPVLSPWQFLQQK